MKFTIDEFSMPAGEWVKLGLPVSVVDGRLLMDGEDIYHEDREALLRCELCFAVDVVVTDFRPGRPAPSCSNPFSSAFGDPGDEPEIEFSASVEGHDMPEMYNHMPFFDLVLERCEKYYAD